MPWGALDTQVLAAPKAEWVRSKWAIAWQAYNPSAAYPVPWHPEKEALPSTALVLKRTNPKREVKRICKLFGMNHSPSMMVLLGESLLESNGLKITTSVTQQDFFFPSESIRFEQPSLLHIPESEYRFLVSVPQVSCTAKYLLSQGATNIL